MYRVDAYTSKNRTPEHKYFDTLSQACDWSWANANLWKTLIFKSLGNGGWLSL